MRVNQSLRLVSQINSLPPVKRHAPANLNVTRCLSRRLNVDNLLGLYKIGNVSSLIDTSRVVPGPESVPIPPRQETQRELLPSNENRLDFND
jgi:hypothetical protein